MPVSVSNCPSGSRDPFSQSPAVPVREDAEPQSRMPRLPVPQPFADSAPADQFDGATASCNARDQIRDAVPGCRRNNTVCFYGVPGAAQVGDADLKFHEIPSQRGMFAAAAATRQTVTACGQRVEDTISSPWGAGKVPAPRTGCALSAARRCGLFRRRGPRPSLTRLGPRRGLGRRRPDSRGLPSSVGPAR